MVSLKERLLNVLKERQLISPEQLEEALSLHRTQGGNLQKILIEKGFVTEADLLAAMSQGMGVPPITLQRFKLDPALKKLIPREVAAQYELVPVSCMGRTLTVAMVDPMNVIALDTLTTLTGLSINPLLATARDVRDAIDTYYGTGVEETLREIVRRTESQELEFVTERTEQESGNVLSQIQEAPVVKFTDALLAAAVRLRASDLIIEPREKTVRVRYRVDGVLQEGKAPPKALQAAIVSRLKVMAELNIAERRLPQDGHFNFKFEDRVVDFRLSILPSAFGGTACLRVLDKG